MVKNLPAMQETRLQSLGLEGPLENEMATHSSILAWEVPWTEELGGLQSTGHKESDTTEPLGKPDSAICTHMSTPTWTCLPLSSCPTHRSHHRAPS